jgi:hypothetical protein
VLSNRGGNMALLYNLLDERLDPLDPELSTRSCR